MVERCGVLTAVRCGVTVDIFCYKCCTCFSVRFYFRVCICVCQVETDKEYNTLFPKWNDLPKPLYYNGTWSELQNEIMMIRVNKPC